MILILLGVVTLIIVWYNFIYLPTESNGRFDDMEFRKCVEYVEYRNKIDVIEFDDGSEISFVLNLFHPKMEQFSGKKFSEFIFPGDSIIKYHNKGYVIVKPQEGRPFILIYGM